MRIKSNYFRLLQDTPAHGMLQAERAADTAAQLFQSV
jgi:hypothetical protein